MMSAPTTARSGKSGVAHFSISGDWLTEHVRERVLSDMEESALLLLVENLEGMTHEHAIAILLGKKRLTGVNNLELVDEDPDAARTWHGTLLSRYGIRCELRGPSGRRGWFRPRAYITDLGPNDVSGEWNRIKIGRNNRARFSYSRIAHYAGDDEVALSSLDIADPSARIDPVAAFGRPGIPGLDGVTGGLGWIFEATAHVPSWLRHLAAKSPTEALRAAVGANWPMEARGHSLWYPDVSLAHGRTLRSAFIAAEEAAAQDPRNSPELREGSARRAENLKAAQVREEARAAEVEAKAQERRAQEAEQRDAEARERRVAERARIAAEVRAAAGPVDGDGWFTMTIMPGAPAEYAVRVPRLPFTCWALWRTNLADQMPPYSPVSESGMRLFGDDPYHNDWMIGAFPDRDVWDTYRDEEVRAASYGAMREIQREIGGFDAAVLSGRGYVSGHVVQPQGPEDEIPPGSIAVLPDARPHWDRVVRLAAGTIVPTGGELCHLAVVAGEAQRIIMRVPDCLQRYPHGQWVELDTETGRVTLDARTPDVPPIHPRFQ